MRSALSHKQQTVAATPEEYLPCAPKARLPTVRVGWAMCRGSSRGWESHHIGDGVTLAVLEAVVAGTDGYLSPPVEFSIQVMGCWLIVCGC